jgi:hypothetical protein
MDILQEIKDALVPNLYSIIIDYVTPIKYYFDYKEPTRNKLYEEEPYADTLYVLNKYLYTGIGKIVLDYTTTKYTDLFDIKKETYHRNTQLSIWSEVAVGAQDTAFKSHKDTDLNKDVSYLDRHKIDFSGVVAGGKKTYTTFPRGYSIKNGLNTVVLILHLKPNSTVALRDLIDYIELNIGGSRIDRIYGDALDFLLYINKLKYLYDPETGILRVPLPFDLMIKDKILPIYYLAYHVVRLECGFCASDIIMDGHIEYDELIVHALNYDYIHIDIQMRMKQLQFTGDENINNPISNILLLFNHPTHFVYFFLTDTNNNIIKENIIDKLKLSFNNVNCIDADENNIICKHMIDKFPGYYFLIFNEDSILHKTGPDHTVNFSRIDQAKIHINIDNKKYTKYPIQIHYFGISENLLRVSHGMAGLRYSH